MVKKQVLVALQVISVVITVILSIVYISLDFYYYYSPQAFDMYNLGNIPYVVLTLVAIGCIVCMLVFFMQTLLYVRALNMPYVAESSLLTVIWVLSGGIVAFLIAFIFFPSLIIGVFIPLGLFFFLLQTSQGLEEVIYSLSTLFLGHRRLFEELKLDPGEGMIKLSDHLFLLGASVVFLVVQSVSFIPFFAVLFTDILPLLREFFVAFSLEWIVDFLLIPLFQFLQLLAQLVLMPLLIFIDLDFLANFSQLARLFSAALVLFLFVAPTIRQARAMWLFDPGKTIKAGGDIFDQVGSLKEAETIRGLFVHNPLYKVREEGRVFLASFGRITFTYLLSILFLYALAGTEVALMNVIELGLSFLVALIIGVLAIKRLIGK